MWGARLWDSRAGGSGPGNQAARAELDLENDRYALSLDRVHVGKDFDPALGFLRRRDMDEWSLWGGFRPRFESSGWARRFSVWGGGVRTRGTGGELQSERLSSNADLLFESGERVSVVVDDRFERLHGPASISGRILPPGDYHFRFWEAYGSTNESRMLSMSLEGSRGGFWSGRRTRYAGSVVVKTGPHLTVGSRIARNRVSLPVADGDFTTTLVAFDITGAVSRKLFAGALVQWDSLSRELQANIRVDWIHTPGSDLFLVLDTGYITDDTLDPRLDPWTRRTAVAKLTWLKAF